MWRRLLERRKKSRKSSDRPPTVMLPTVAESCDQATSPTHPVSPIYEEIPDIIPRISDHRTETETRFPFTESRLCPEIPPHRSSPSNVSRPIRTNSCSSSDTYNLSVSSGDSSDGYLCASKCSSSTDRQPHTRHPSYHTSCHSCTSSSASEDYEELDSRNVRLRKRDGTRPTPHRSTRLSALISYKNDIDYTDNAPKPKARTFTKTPLKSKVNANAVVTPGSYICMNANQRQINQSTNRQSYPCNRNDNPQKKQYRHLLDKIDNQMCFMTELRDIITDMQYGRCEGDVSDYVSDSSEQSEDEYLRSCINKYRKSTSDTIPSSSTTQINPASSVSTTHKSATSLRPRTRDVINTHPRPVSGIVQPSTSRGSRLSRDSTVRDDRSTNTSSNFAKFNPRVEKDPALKRSHVMLYGQRNACLNQLILSNYNKL